jgi:thiosulfate dehydrogenase [quinone] large subunit
VQARGRAVAPPRRPATKRGPSGSPSAGALLRRLQEDPRWILLALRGYLGFTFLYAGISKVGTRSFLDGSAPTSMHATLLAVKGQSPIGGLLGPVEHHSFAFGLLIALGETAVGTGVLLGLFARVAALGGMVISLSLFLTVSWNATPWYTGADIVYLFALTPVLLGGAGPLSADEWLAQQRERDTSADPVAADRGRRVILGGLAALAGLIALGVAGLVRGGSSAGSSDAARSGATPSGATPSGATPSGAHTTPSSGPAPSSSASTSSALAGTPVLAASAIPVGGAAEATDPVTGDPMYVLQLQPGKFTALDRICPHQGCAVTFISGSAGFECPCHLSTFDPSGAVTGGPAPTGLAKIPVTKSGGEIVRT